MGLIQEGNENLAHKTIKASGLVGNQYTIETTGNAETLVLVMTPRVEHTTQGLVPQPGALVRIEKAGS